MKPRRCAAVAHRCASLALMFAFLATASFAVETPFNAAQFEAQRAAGKPVAVVFHADWCPTCRAQAPVLKQLMQTPEFKDVILFVADFDTEKALKRSLGVPRATPGKRPWQHFCAVPFRKARPSQ
jgi:thioredoxin 1